MSIKNSYAGFTKTIKKTTSKIKETFINLGRKIKELLKAIYDKTKNIVTWVSKKITGKLKKKKEEEEKVPKEKTDKEEKKPAEEPQTKS